MRGALAVAAVAAVCLVPAPTDACIHPGGGGRVVPISQEGQHAIAFFDGETEHLVVKIDYRADQPLDGLGIVMPVPAVPKDYGTARPGLFRSLHEWVNVRREPERLRSRHAGGGGGGSSSSPLHMLPPAEAGPYRIQPMQASGAAGVTALRTWMRDNGYAPIPAEALGYFATRNWTFLAVRVDPAEGKQKLEASGGLPPFRVSFATDRIIYPLKLEAQGVFPVRLYVVTPEPLDPSAFRGAREKGFELVAYPRTGGGGLFTRVHDFDVDQSPEALRWLMQQLGPPFSDGTHYVRILYARFFGADRADPSTWDEELAIPPPAEGERLEGVVAQAPGAEATSEHAAAAGQPSATPAGSSSSGCGACTTAGPDPSGALPALAVLLLVVRARRRQ